MTTRIMGRPPKPTETRKTPRQKRSQQTRHDLLDGATRVLRQRGAAGLTTNHVAEQAGVSVGSLYQYYPNKTALLSDLHAEEGTRLWNDIALVLQDRQQPLATRLHVALETVFVAQVLAFEHHAALDQLGVDILASEEFRALRAQFQAELERLLRRERARSADLAESQAAFAVMTVIGLLLQLARTKSDVDAARLLAARTAHMLTAYLELEETSAP